MTSTSRERYTLAPYLRLENSKMTSKCQVFSFTVLENPEVRPNWCAKRGTLWDFSAFLLQNIKKNEGGPFGEKEIRKNHNAKKNWKGDPLVSP